MSNNKQSVELTDITAPLLAATQGLTMEDHVCIISLLQCAKRGETLGKQSPPSIREVPRILREHNESSFIPQLVSIGPIHRENKKLQEFEWQKECYLNDLLSRCDSTPKETLEACLLKVNTLIPKIRESYAGVINNYSDVEFATMMVMDGCFILEFCFKHDGENLYLPKKMQNTRIAMDLMLLENQVPFCVLQHLFDCFIGEQSFTLSNVLDEYLVSYLKLFFPLPEKKSILSKYLAPYVKLFRSLLPEIFSTTNVYSVSEKISTTPHDHLLGYMHKRYHLEVAEAKLSKRIHDEEIENTHTSGHSVAQLGRSGMNFKPLQEDIWSTTIQFQPGLPWFLSKPTLLMPTLFIDNFTEVILRNFIAYEQSFPQVCDRFTSYAVAMDILIDTQEDIAKLVESKVLVNTLGSNQEAADMINKIRKDIFVKNFCYNKEFKQMDEYYNGYWPKNIARLRRVYFSNPWSYISLLAGIIVSLATVVAAIFAVLDYFR